MVDFSKIMALSEATNGFNGGSYVDEIPNYTLDEAVNYLPVMIMESQIEQYDMVAAQNELIVEAVVTSAHSGDNSAFESINEAALSGLIEKARNTFEKIRKFLAGVVVKFKAFIARHITKSEEFFNKYGKNVDPAKCKDLTFTGYSFDKEINIEGKVDIDSILSEVYGKAYATFDGSKTPSDIKSVGDQSPQRMGQVATIITGIQLSDNGWYNELTNKLKDDNKTSEMKYGEKCFKIETVKKFLTDKSPYEGLKKAYDKMLTDVQSRMNQVGTFEREEKNEKGTDRHTYLHNYLKAYSEVSTAISQVSTLAKKYYDDRWKQATQMLIAMAKASGAKVKEEKPAEEKPGDNKPEEKKEEK